VRATCDHRTDTGKYDDDIPASFTYVTNIYWWDGGAQNVPRITRLMASVAVGEEYRNMTSGFVSGQGQQSMGSGTPHW
jgi:hypothetical protein